VAGYSSGGTIAYEIAHQLIRADETVAFLGLIDTSYTEAAATPPHFTDEAAYLLQQCETGLATRVTASILEELKNLASAGHPDAMLVRCQEVGLIPGDIDNDALRRYVKQFMTTDEALARYTLPPVPAPLSLFAATQDSQQPRNTHSLAVDARNTGAFASDRLLGWKKLAGERLRIIPIGGSHTTLLEPPHIQHLGAAIMNALTCATAC
jgi:thioesterase domain-containing protein